MQTHQTPAGIAMALDAAGMLQSPETVAEAERLRARVAELVEQRDDLLVESATADVQADELCPWQRATDGLNALVDAGIPVHVEPDGHISNPCGTENIEWDGAAGRWRLVHDDDPGPTPAESAARLRGILAPSASGPERRTCGAVDDYDRACDLREHATGDHSHLIGPGLDELVTWPAVAAPAGPPEPHSCGICGVPERRVHGLRPSPGGGTHRWTAPTGEQIQARMQERRAIARAAGGERP